jgi:hypothetical protein
MGPLVNNDSYDVFHSAVLGELVLRHSQLLGRTVHVSHILCSKGAIVTLDRYRLDRILLVDGDSRYSVLS